MAVATRPRPDGTTRRRRICVGCGKKFSTIERLSEDDKASTVERSIGPLPADVRQIAADLVVLLPAMQVRDRKALVAFARHFTRAHQARVAAASRPAA